MGEGRDTICSPEYNTVYHTLPMKEIQLTQGKVALVDDADFEWLSQYKWQASKEGHSWYAVRACRDSLGRKSKARMHRDILKCEQDVDHRDLNGLNNQRYNLRPCNDSQNQHNRRRHVANTSGFIGVHKVKGSFASEHWQSRIAVNRRRIHLGYFLNKEDAARAYDEAARKYFGEFARTNYGD